MKAYAVAVYGVTISIWFNREDAERECNIATRNVAMAGGFEAAAVHELETEVSAYE